MAPSPPSFSSFKRNHLKACGERDPPEDAHCPICTEEYNRSKHRAMRIQVVLPAPCSHVFCRTCLNAIFAKRKEQHGRNRCPICLAVWFEAEYESAEAQVWRLTANHTGQVPYPFEGFTGAAFRFPLETASGSMLAPGEYDIDQAASVSGSATPLFERTRRPYHRTSEREPQAARATAFTRDAKNPSDWRSQPVYLYREVHRAISADRARNVSSQADSTIPPYPNNGHAHPNMSPFGGPNMRQGTAGTTPPIGSRAERNHTTGPIHIPPEADRNRPTDERSRAAPPQTQKEKDSFRRETALKTREAELKQGEERLQDEQRKLRERQQQFDAASERMRAFLRSQNSDS
ncbi:hypothetical protein TW65_01150 [Stemphylium lycopersici]|uniref:RING-type domain-containing protein n=1 Tax=Stemphylium lycopersici TaxID=183478 RepID=A0A364MVL2_STELY|nr:hypothetical protein TW65_01150 [Stemphylium lycopersici]RAR04920.1 hypothetical protein DDE83_007620 [Stemphylium lycopersici]